MNHGQFPRKFTFDQMIGPQKMLLDESDLVIVRHYDPFQVDEVRVIMGSSTKNLKR